MFKHYHSVHLLYIIFRNDNLSVKKPAVSYRVLHIVFLWIVSNCIHLFFHYSTPPEGICNKIMSLVKGFVHDWVYHNKRSKYQIIYKMANMKLNPNNVTQNTNSYCTHSVRLFRQAVTCYYSMTCLLPDSFLQFNPVAVFKYGH